MDSAGLTPFDIETVEDLKKIPFLEKDTIRKEVDSTVLASGTDLSKILPVVTSGSTGEPLKLYADKDQLELRFATTLRAMEWTGWQFGDPMVRLWHQTLGMKVSQIFREFVDAWFLKRRFIPAYEISVDKLPGFFSKISSNKPYLIDGYAESFNFLARYLEVHKGALPFKPKAVMSSAQIMPKHIRELIEERFDCKVFDKYGSREFSGIAYEDQSNTGHLVQMESYIVELLSKGEDAAPGEMGEIVITDLNNYSVPMIRYRIGDLARVPVEHDLQESRKFQRIGDIEGRTQALVVCDNGTLMPGTFFAHFFKEFNASIKHYQVVQNEDYSITLKLVPADKEVFDREVSRVISKLKEFTGQDSNISVQVENHIEMGRTGKRTPVISKVKLDYQKLN